MEQHTSSHAAHLGNELARWANNLDLQDDQANWWLSRTLDALRTTIGAARPVHESFQQLRRRIAPALKTTQVQRLDQLLEDPHWRTADLQALRCGFEHGSVVAPLPG